MKKVEKLVVVFLSALVVALALSLCSVSMLPTAKAQVWQEQVIEKRCSNCGKRVPLSARPGQRCPYCGALWVAEVKRYKCLSCGKVLPSNYRRGKRCPYCGGTPYNIIEVPIGGEEEEPITIDIGDRTLIETEARIVKGHTLVPLRVPFEKMGATVDWDAKYAVATISMGERMVELQLGYRELTVKDPNGVRKVTLPVAGGLYGWKTYVPLRGICEALGLEVQYQDGVVFIGDDYAIRLKRRVVANPPIYPKVPRKEGGE